MNRTIGSVPEGRTCTQRSRHESLSPSRASALASGKRRRSASYTGAKSLPRGAFAFTIRYRGCCRHQLGDRCPVAASRCKIKCHPHRASRPMCSAGRITPPLPSPPITAPSSRMARATLASPTGARTNRAPASPGRVLDHQAGGEVGHHHWAGRPGGADRALAAPAPAPPAPRRPGCSPRRSARPVSSTSASRSTSGSTANPDRRPRSPAPAAPARPGSRASAPARGGSGRRSRG